MVQWDALRLVLGTQQVLRVYHCQAAAPAQHRQQLHVLAAAAASSVRLPWEGLSSSQHPRDAWMLQWRKQLVQEAWVRQPQLARAEACSKGRSKNSSRQSWLMCSHSSSSNMHHTLVLVLQAAQAQVLAQRTRRTTVFGSRVWTMPWRCCLPRLDSSQPDAASMDAAVPPGECAAEAGLC